MISVLRDKVGQILVPGDEFCCGSEDTISLTAHAQPEKVVFGPGLRRSANRLQVCKSGVLRHKEPNMFWMDSQQRRVSLPGPLQLYFFPEIRDVWVVCLTKTAELSVCLCSVCPHQRRRGHRHRDVKDRRHFQGGRWRKRAGVSVLPGLRGSHQEEPTQRSGESRSHRRCAVPAGQDGT